MKFHFFIFFFIVLNFFYFPFMAKATVDSKQKLSSYVLDGIKTLRKDFKLSDQTKALIYDYDNNKLYLFHTEKDGHKITIDHSYVVSGGRGGVSNDIKSGGTPPGVHNIFKKQGSDYKLDQTFDAGKYGYAETILTPTEKFEDWNSDFVLTRILRLQGLEGEKNNHSIKRSILIHGTPEEGLLGYHESGGCLRMNNKEIIDLFNQVSVNTLVNIVYDRKKPRRVNPKLLTLVDESKIPELKPLHKLKKNIKNNCKHTDQVHLLAVGDILFHGGLHTQAILEKNGFESLWAPVQKYMNQANLIYGNLEGPSAPGVNASGKFKPNATDNYDPDNGIYSTGTEGISYAFNFHPTALKALKKSGFTLVSTANNHAFDRKQLGIYKTIETLDEIGLNFVGTSNPSSSRELYKVIYKNGMQIAFVSCTYGIQGGVVNENIISYCFEKDSSPNIKLIKTINSLANKNDLVVLLPHWGTEYDFTINELQKKLADSAIAAGARLILGSHPHFVQPVEIRKNKNGEIESIIAFSLANFVTNQMPYDYKNTSMQEKTFPQRVSMLFFLNIQKTNHKITFENPRLLPVYMTSRKQNSKHIRELIPAYPELYKGQKDLLSAVKKSREIITNHMDENLFMSLEEAENVFGCL